jgi:hypothetical protein
MPQHDIDHDRIDVFRLMAGERADRYVEDILTPSIRACLEVESNDQRGLFELIVDPLNCLKTVFGVYAFARRGKDRGELSEIAVDSLIRVAGDDQMESFLAQPNARSLWNEFVDICHERKRKPLEQLNCGVIAGLAELSQEIARLSPEGSIASWIVEGVLQTGRVEPQFFRMVDVRGVGPKLASLLLRDFVFLSGSEDEIDLVDRLYTIPIDKWMRMIAPVVIDDPYSDQMADWILAGKVAKHARLAGVSPIRFTMGTTYFGMRELRFGEDINERISELVGAKISLH